MASNPTIVRAIKAIGGDDAFMAALGIKRRTLFYLKEGKRLTPERALHIERLTGIPRHELRPDLWQAAA